MPCAKYIITRKNADSYMYLCRESTHIFQQMNDSLRVVILFYLKISAKSLFFPIKKLNSHQDLHAGALSYTYYV